VVRVFRVLRGLRATKVLTTAVLRHRAQNTFVATALVALLLIVFCAIAVLHFEIDAQSNIRTAEDALWWGVTTVTTVGYGDRYPVTSEGRLIALILMGAGVGLFGTLSGFLASWFLAPGEKSSESEIAQLRKEIAEIRELIANRG
jgi:voltage-gated potassium channel